MKRLLAATVIFMSSCTAYADYATTKHCSNIGNIVVQFHEQMNQGMSERDIVDKIIMRSEPMDNAKAIFLAAFAESTKSMYTTKRDYYMSAGETCLKIMQVAHYYGVESVMVMHEAKPYFQNKGW